MSTIAQLSALKQRRQQLAIQEARYGISADPSITIERQQLETVIGQMERIDIHRGNLTHLLRQRGHFGADVPAHIINDIAHERSEIAALRAACAQADQPVDAHPVDADPPLAAATPAHPIDPTDINERLQDIEWLLDRALMVVRQLQQEINA